MRIISGQFKGRRLTAPKKLPVRPTTDMAKEALFNILNNRYYLNEIRVLDLFAGTGNISYEFASRGTMDITAVDKHAACTKYIDQINRELELNINIIKADVFSFLENYTTKSDVIFADPPYDMDAESLKLLIGTVFKNELLNSQGTLIVEHSKHTDLSDLDRFDVQKRYGGNCFSFFN